MPEAGCRRCLAHMSQAKELQKDRKTKEDHAKLKKNFERLAIMKTLVFEELVHELFNYKVIRYGAFWQ